MPEGFGFNAWISTGKDDEALLEYGVETDLEKKEVRCWIPSQTGKTFKVVWKNLAHYTTDTAGFVKVDGVQVGGKIAYKQVSLQDTRLSIKDRVATSPTSTRRFVFAPVKLTDDDSLLELSSAKHIGSISLNLEEAELRGKTRPTQGQIIPEQNIAHERSNKGIVHCVGFSPEEKTESANVVQDYTPKKKLGTFIFRYRPLDVLQANRIAPRNPSPETHELSHREIPPETYKKGKPNGTKKIGSDKDSEEAKNTEKSGNKRKLDAAKFHDGEDNDDDDESEEMKLIQARIRKLEREQELEDLRDLLRELADNRSNAKRVKKESSLSGEVINLS